MSCRTIEILTAIQNGQPFNAETISRSEAILKSIANKTAYTETPQSKYEKILLAIKNGAVVEDIPQTRLEEILTAIANETFANYLDGKNLFDANKAYLVTEKQDGYAKYTIYTGLPSAKVFVNTNTPDDERRDGFLLKCAHYDYSATYAWLYSGATVQGSTIGTTDTAGRISFYWSSENVEKEVVIKHFNKMQVTVGTTATPFAPFAFFSEIESAYIAAAIKLKG